MAAARRLPAGVAALDAALSQALFTRFGGKQGPARRCGTHAQAAVSLLARSHSAAHVADALAACCLPHARSFLKMMERLGQGWLWFGAPIAVLVLSDDAALRRDATTLLAAMLLDLAVVATIKARVRARGSGGMLRSRRR
jgi:hypothetical protein